MELSLLFSRQFLVVCFWKKGREKKREADNLFGGLCQRLWKANVPCVIIKINSQKDLKKKRKEKGYLKKKKIVKGGGR